MKSKSVIVRNLIWSLAGLAVMLVISFLGWSAIPAGKLIATHWGPTGEANGFSSKATGLILTPIITLGMVGIFALIAYIEPRKEHLQASLKALSYIWLSVIGLFIIIHAYIIMNAIGYRLDINIMMGLSIGILFVIIGNVMGKVRSNWFMGLRTPWTLSSEYVWNKCNRVAGKMFFGLGIIVAIVSLFGNQALSFGIMTFGAISMAILMVVHSFVVWKNEQNHTKPGFFEERVLAISIILVLLAGVFIYSFTKPFPAEITKLNTGTAVKITNSIAKGDYQSIRPLYNKVMGDALTDNQLKDAWDGITKTFGSFQSIENTREERYLSNQIIHCIVRFSKGKLDVKVVFDKNGKVSGLWFKPV